MRTPRKLFRRILVPHDFSDDSDHALAIAAVLAAQHAGRIHVLHVITPLYAGSTFAPEAGIAWVPPAATVKDYRQNLERRTSRVLGSRARLATCRVALGEAVTTILQASRRADVIVMATLGRTGLAHLLLGSVAEKVVRHSPIPVLTLRSPVSRRKGRTRVKRR
jgi:universal stress protein A